MTAGHTAFLKRVLEYASRHEASLREAGLYVAVATISPLVFIWPMDLWSFLPDLSMPLSYQGGDTLFSAAFYIRTPIDYGWPFQNPMLGAPLGLDLHAFPVADALHLGIIRAISLFTHSWPVVFNLFYLLGYPLSALSALFLVRKFSVSRPAAGTVAILFAFLPYHFARNQSHLFLSAYYVVPLTTLVILWISLGDTFTLRRRWMAATMMVLTGLAGIYYAFFGALLLGFAGLYGSARTRNFRPMIAALLCMGILSAVLVVALGPNIVFFLRHGTGMAIKRSPQEAELYGLRMTQLLLPATGHRVQLLSRLKQSYNFSGLAGVPVTESDDASLGIIGSVGFLALLVALVPGFRRGPLWESLSSLNFFALVTATIGGASAGLVYVLPEIRCYNRISIYIALWSLFAASLLWDSAMVRLKPRLRRIGPMLLAPILIVGLLDQIPPVSQVKLYGTVTNARKAKLGLTQAVDAQQQPYEEVRAAYMNDLEFVRRIEQLLPAGAMVFQLPIVPFPENPPLGKMLDYDLLRGYLCSRNLRWSYPTMNGSPAEAWQQQIGNRPLPLFLSDLSSKGFKGIYIDRSAYPPYVLQPLEQAISELEGPPAAASSNKRLVLYLIGAGHPGR